jgi:hypothetical protein
LSIAVIRNDESGASDVTGCVRPVCLAAGLLNTGQQLGGALGLAVLSATATAHTTSLLEAGEDTLAAATGGYQWALVAGAGFALGAAVIALFSSNTHQAAPVTEEEPALDLAA